MSVRDTSYEAVIGLEIHLRLKTESKAFCGCSAVYGAEPNSSTCPVCLGYPGAMPALNREMVSRAMLLALALGARIHQRCKFDRKHYFYPDLAKGYQISMYDEPLARGGSLKLEYDAARNLHRAERTAVDFNRAGVPLAELVTEPDLRTPPEAVALVDEVRRLVRWLGICDGDMERGSLRCNANVSLRGRGSGEPGTRTELKNLNSLRGLRRALDREIRRQEEILRCGGKIRRETRLFDQRCGRTVPARGKEAEQDYRYFPEPDLPLLEIGEAWIEDVSRRLPELPRRRRRSLIDEYGLSFLQADRLCADRSTAEYFERTAAVAGDPAAAADWVLGELRRLLKDRGVCIEDCPREVERYLAGRRSLLDHFLGRVQRELGGSGDPAIVREALLERLDELGAGPDPGS